MEPNPNPYEIYYQHCALICGDGNPQVSIKLWDQGPSMEYQGYFSAQAQPILNVLVDGRNDRCLLLEDAYLQVSSAEPSVEVFTIRHIWEAWLAWSKTVETQEEVPF